MSMPDDIVKVQLDELWPVMAEQIATGGSVRFSPKGTSMLPMLRQNIDSVVLVKANRKLKKYDLPLYRRENGQFVLHRVVGVKNDSYTMCGDNQYVYEYGIKDEQILAIMEGFYRGDSYVSSTDKKYRAYCKKQVAKQHTRGILLKIRHKIGNILRFLRLYK
ncbi:MAG: S24/S26 family peptidase [Eubacteriales bacterium]|nr:S24/S26 family peptidase [Eubacteriales bacterium]